ncbi:MAG: hypothetical protein IJW55_07885 [Clostridia bacterium]|nr:hypothetical protein [Clostridia bacterium]
MENENKNLLETEEAICDATEEVSVCNCENTEQATVYQADDTGVEAIDTVSEAAEESPKDMLTRKCREVKDACRSTADRLMEDWKKTDGKPYIKQTMTCRLDIYKNPDDETPVDTFYTEKIKTCSVRTLAIVGTAAFALMCTAECIVKKLFGK